MTSSSWRRLIAAIRHVHILLALATVSASATLFETDPFVIVPFIDVGQRDAVWVRMPNDVDMPVGDRPPSQGDELLLFLGEQGVIHIEVMVLTLADADHVGGLNAALKNMSFDRVWLGDPPPRDPMKLTRIVSRCRTTMCPPAPYALEIRWLAVNPSAPPSSPRRALVPVPFHLAYLPLFLLSLLVGWEGA